MEKGKKTVIPTTCLYSLFNELGKLDLNEL